MKKLRLELDHLRVESFRTGAGEGSGTVVGHHGGPSFTVPTDDTTDDWSRAQSCYFNTCYDGCQWDSLLADTE